MKHPELMGYAGRPPEKEVSDHTQRLNAAVFLDEIGQELSEGGFKRGTDCEEVDYEVVGKDVGVFATGREAVIGAVERDFMEANGGGG